MKGKDSSIEDLEARRSFSGIDQRDERRGRKEESFDRDEST